MNLSGSLTVVQAVDESVVRVAQLNVDDKLLTISTSCFQSDRV